MILLFDGCSDLFEKDLSDNQLLIHTPADLAVIHSGTVEFWWDEMEGATYYKLILVEGTIKSPSSLIIDTNVQGNVFSLYLGSGEYEWTLQAMNESSESHATKRVLSVDSISSLENEIIVLTKPSANGCTSGDSVLFEWVALQVPNTRYVIDIRTGLFDDAQTIYSYELISNSIYLSIDPLFEGQLSWGVRAVNDESASAYSSRILYLDNSIPAQPSLTLPLDGDTTALSPSFQWSASTGSGCSEWDSIRVYSDSLFTQLVLTAETAAGINSLQGNLSQGKYWWNVQRYDQAGNHSMLSLTKSFYAED